MQGMKTKLFAKCHELVMKDMETTFDVLHAQFAIVPGPSLD